MANVKIFLINLKHYRSIYCCLTITVGPSILGPISLFIKW